MKKLLLIILTAFALSTLNSSSVLAQGLQVQGLGIDPFLIEVNMAPGQSVTKSITLSNTTNDPLTFTASINDFIPNGSTGQPVFLSSDKESDPKFSLSKWITITQQPQFTIPALSKTEVEFAVTVPADAEPGTHYGGILFGQSLGQLGASGSAVEHKAGAVILVKLGESQERVRVAEFFTQHRVYQHGPIEFVLSAHNFGNVHSKVKGDIKIRNIWGIQITEVPVNPDAQIVLPESARDFSQSWNNKLGFGRYTAEAILYYGSPKIELRVETSFWIIPLKEIILGVLFTIILAIIVYIGLKRYNRYIINKSKNVS